MCCSPASTSPENAPGNARSLLEALWETAGLFFQTDPPDGSRLRPHAEGVPKGKPKEMPKSHACRTPGASEDAMTELRRIKMKMGDAAFEADVPEDRLQPMYDNFIAMLERRKSRTVRRVFSQNGNARNDKIFGGHTDAVKPEPDVCLPPAAEIDPAEELYKQNLLVRIFDVHLDGFVILKILPQGDEKDENEKVAEALLLILYGYWRLKNERHVLATRLLCAAKHSGIFAHRVAPKLTTHDRFVVRAGHRKASTYALTPLGLARAEEIGNKLID
jgi:hypothetical protein